MEIYICLGIFAIQVFVLVLIYKKLTNIFIFAQLELSKFKNELNPTVLYLYDEFINNPNSFTSTHCEIRHSSGISFWSANSEWNRRLTGIHSEVFLSKADKMILEKIKNKVEKNEKEFISKVFLE
jgi:hypothetical protein